MSAWASAYARDTYGLDVTTGSLESARLPADSFDAVVLADVIEHLFDPRADRRARSIACCAPGGVCCC